MIARISIIIIIATLLAYGYIDHVFFRKRWAWWKRLIVMIVPAFILYETWCMTRIPDYFPESTGVLSGYLHLLVCGVIAPSLFALLLFICRLFKPKRMWAVLTSNILIIGLPLLVVAGWCYGYFVGFYEFEVHHVELEFEDLPETFDGYKIVQFSDLHVGTLKGKREQILQRCVDSINAQHADLVAFVGDMQNMRPSEVEPFKELLSTIKAKDGVYSVLGNHDYAEYVNADMYSKVYMMEEAMGAQENLGWTVLCNSRRVIRRDSTRIAIAGMENDGEGRFPQEGNLSEALYGLHRDVFVIMLEHDPTSWRRKIMPHSHVQLTLSGHTHGGQFKLFGWSPASLRYPECDGIYEYQNRVLSVSKGVGGVIPFRLGAPGEIVVITLKKKK